MMKLALKYSGFVLAFFILFTSCSTSKDVVSDSRFQKRKYTKGYFINISKSDNNLASNPQDKVETPSSEATKTDDQVEKKNTKSEKKKETKIALNKRDLKSSPKEESSTIKDNPSDNTVAAKSEKKEENKTNSSPKFLEKLISEKEFIPKKRNTETKEALESNEGSLGRQGLILIIAGLLIELLAGILSLSALAWIGGIFVLVGLIFVILHLLGSL